MPDSSLNTVYEDKRPSYKGTGTLGSLGWIGFERLVRLLVGIVVGSMVARHLGPVDFGRLQVALSWIALVTVAANLGLDTILQREFATSTIERAKNLFNTALGLRLTGACVGLIVILLGAFSVNDWTQRILLIVIACTVFQPAGAIMELWLQAKGLNSVSTYIQIGVLAISSTLRIILIYANAGVIAFGVACVVEMLTVVVMFAWIGTKYELKFSLELFSRIDCHLLLKQGLPLLGSIIAATFYQKIDLLLVSRFCNLHEVGEYGVAVRLSEVAYIVPTALAAAAVPRLAQAYKEGSYRYQSGYDACLALSVGIGVLLSGIIMILAPLLVHVLFGVSFLGSIKLLQIRCMVLFFLCLEVGRSMRLIQEGKTSLVMIAHLYGAIVMLVFGPVLIKTWGTYGAAVSVVLAMAFPGWIAAWFHSETRKDAYRIVVLCFRPDKWISAAKFLFEGRLDKQFINSIENR